MPPQLILNSRSIHHLSLFLSLVFFRPLHSLMEMETLLHRTTVDLEMILCSLVAETSLQAQKFLLGLLLLIGSPCYGRNEFSSFPGVDHRFPFTQLTEVQKPDAEAKDAGEADETESDDDDDGGEEEEDDSGEEESDEEEDSDDDAEANGNGESDEDDEEEDEEDDDDDDDDDNEDDDDDEEEDEEQREPPSKKKK